MLAIRTLAAVGALLALSLGGAMSTVLADEDHVLSGQAVHGEITAMSGTTWTISTQAHGDVMIDVSGAEVLGGSANLTLGEFIIGDVVNIKLMDETSTSGLLKADGVILVPSGGEVEAHAQGQAHVEEAKHLGVTPPGFGLHDEAGLHAQTDAKAGEKANVQSHGGLGLKLGLGF